MKFLSRRLLSVSQLKRITATVQSEKASIQHLLHGDLLMCFYSNICSKYKTLLHIKSGKSYLPS